MWWNSLDLASVPTAPRPGWVARQPQWHSSYRSRLPIDKCGPPITPLSLDAPSRPGKKNLPKHQGAAPRLSKEQIAVAFAGRLQLASDQPTLGRATGTRASSTPAPSPARSRRPKSAPNAFGVTGAAAKARAGSAGGRRPSATRNGRPQSAPTMLRGWDGQRSMRMAHEDDFLQMVEDYTVKNNRETFKREKHLCRDKVDGIDALADSSLYDLKVLHNAVQRSKAAASGKRPQSAGSPAKSPAKSERLSPSKGDRAGERKQQVIDATATDRVKVLCQELVSELRKNGQRCSQEEAKQQGGVKPSALELALREYIAPSITEETRKKGRLTEFMSGWGGFFHSSADKNATPPTFEEDELALPESPAKQEARPVLKRVVAEPAPELTLAAPVAPAAPNKVPAQRLVTQWLGELVGFLIGSCGSVSAAFDDFDSNGNRVLSLQEWEEGMTKLGFKDDVSYVFRLLGKKKNQNATLDEVQTLFNPFLQPVCKR